MPTLPESQPSPEPEEEEPEESTELTPEWMTSLEGRIANSLSEARSQMRADVEQLLEPFRQLLEVSRQSQSQPPKTETEKSESTQTHSDGSEKKLEVTPTPVTATESSPLRQSWLTKSPRRQRQ